METQRNSNHGLPILKIGCNGRKTRSTFHLELCFLSLQPRIIMFTFSKALLPLRVVLCLSLSGQKRKSAKPRHVSALPTKQPCS
jgi:hypothetical protein